MREVLWKTQMPYLIAFGVLIVMMILGCAQDEGGGGQTSEDQTSDNRAAVTEGMTAQQETTTGEETANGQESATQGSTAQGSRGGGQVEITMPQQGQQQQQGRQQTVMVRITGTEGLPFGGRVGTAQELRRVKGSVPEEYEIPFEGTAVTAAVRKQQPGGGTLGVEVVRDGQVVASRETSSSTGIVNVVWTPRPQGN